MHGKAGTRLRDAFSPVIPHARRLKSLTVYAEALPDHHNHFRAHTPLLEKLDIKLPSGRNIVLDGALLNGDLSSLRKLYLDGVVAH